MHGLAALVMTIAIDVTKPRIRGGIKALFCKSLLIHLMSDVEIRFQWGKLAKMSRFPLKNGNILPCDERC